MSESCLFCFFVVRLNCSYIPLWPPSRISYLFHCPFHLHFRSNLLKLLCITWTAPLDCSPFSMQLLSLSSLTFLISCKYLTKGWNRSCTFDKVILSGGETQWSLVLVECVRFWYVWVLISNFFWASIYIYRSRRNTSIKSFIWSSSLEVIASCCLMMLQ